MFFVLFCFVWGLPNLLRSLFLHWAIFWIEKNRCTFFFFFLNEEVKKNLLENAWIQQIIRWLMWEGDLTSSKPSPLPSTGISFFHSKQFLNFTLSFRMIQPFWIFQLFVNLLFPQNQTKKIPLSSKKDDSDQESRAQCKSHHSWCLPARVGAGHGKTMGTLLDHGWTIKVLPRLGDTVSQTVTVFQGVAVMCWFAPASSWVQRCVPGGYPGL